MELSKNTLNFYLKKVPEDHKDLYNSMSVRIGRNNALKNFISVYQELEPLDFGRIMAYLTMVSKIKCESQSKYEIRLFLILRKNIMNVRLIASQFEYH